jgi:hypothetical protein
MARANIVHEKGKENVGPSRKPLFIESASKMSLSSPNPINMRTPSLSRLSTGPKISFSPGYCSRT